MSTTALNPEREKRDQDEDDEGFHQQSSQEEETDMEIDQDDEDGVRTEKKAPISRNDRIFNLGLNICKGIGLVGLLYFFVCSLDLLSLGFRLIGGRTAGEIFRQSDLLQNPVVGVMIGILTTILVQSSSTATSIIVSMVAANFLTVRIAIPIIMGANIGTSITNTIVAFSQAQNRENFQRAFAGATILDMFNWLCVLVLLPIEVISGYLYHFSLALTKALLPEEKSGGQIQLLSVLTKPFVNLILELDKDVLQCWSTPNCTEHDDSSLVKEYCDGREVVVKSREIFYGLDGSVSSVQFEDSVATIREKCAFIFAGTSMSDAAVGAIVLILSLLVLTFCLVMIVKLLSSILQGHMADVVRKTLNAKLPYVPWLTGYLAILIGAFMTFLVQSSSVFTSALTPLVGLGLISLETVYPLTLGANIGTTTTALFASMAVEGDALFPSIQIALCHLLFNISGIILFYPIPFTRFPIGMARVLGEKTAKYRWFAILYMVGMFVILPLITISLSLAGTAFIITFLVLVAIPIIFVLVINCIRGRKPELLPPVLRSWQWVPKPLRSLGYYDSICVKMMSCCRCCNRNDDKQDELTKVETDEPTEVIDVTVDEENNVRPNESVKKTGFDDAGTLV